MSLVLFPSLYSPARLIATEHLSSMWRVSGASGSSAVSSMSDIVSKPFSLSLEAA